MPEFKMNWQQILEAARAGLASAKSGNFSSGSTLPPEQPLPQVTQTPSPQQPPVPQSLFDAFQRPPVQGPPEELQAPEHPVAGLLNIPQHPHRLRDEWMATNPRRSANIDDWRVDTKAHAQELLFYEMVRKLRQSGVQVDLPPGMPDHPDMRRRER